MKQVFLKRTSDDGFQTLGELVCGTFKCKTLELPYLENQRLVSCIPVGRYPCEYTQSGRLTKLNERPVFTYEVLDVPQRSGIRIHSANFAHQLLGCIALGSAFTDINGDGKKDLVNSRATIEKFLYSTNLEDLELIITNEFNLNP